MRILYDPRTREKTLTERGLDFGLLKGRILVIGNTPRGADCHIFSMRKANDREQTRLAPYLGL